jgi:ketosteroid isomerase-like protein
MSEEAMGLAREGFGAWQRGDFDTIEAMLDPAVEWRAFGPRDWDCHGRDEVMSVIRERYEQGFAAGNLEFVDGGEDRVIVVAHPREIGGDDWPEETATVLTFRERKVTRMQDHPTRDEALATT